MKIGELFENYIENMENEDTKWRTYTTYKCTDPYTTKNFMQLFNFNDPEVEEKWLEETLINRAISKKSKDVMSKDTIDVDGIQFGVCYL